MRTLTSFALLKGAKGIRVALDAAGQRIADQLTEKYPPPLVGEQPLFDYRKQVQHLVHELEAAEKIVTAAEDAHMKQEVRVSRLRSERDDKVDESYGKLVAARQSLDSLQGDKGGFETAFVSGAAPRQAEKLLEQLEQSVTLLENPAVEPRQLKVAGFAIDYSGLADDLASGMRELRQKLDELDREKKLAEGTMLIRREAIDELKNTVIWAGRCAEGLFARAGEVELAQRIRSSTRRPLRPSEEATKEKAAAESSAKDEAEEAPPSTGEPSTEADSASDEAGSGSSEPSNS